MSDQTTATPEVETPAQPQTVNLQISDILAAAQCIQLASTRGAYRAEEFTQVGGVYERLISFLKESGALQPAPASSESADESPAE